MRRISTMLIASAAAVHLMGCDQAKTPKSDTEKYSYAIGYQFAKNLKSQNVDFDPAAMKTAIMDVNKGKESQVNEQEMQRVMQKMYEERNAKMKVEGEANLKKGQDYLASNKTKEGVQATATGLQYKVLTASEGAKPKEGDNVKVHYKGTLIDGTEFDSSYKRNEPIEFTLQKGGLIDGWIEGLQLMPKGSKFEFYIPPELAYGERGRPSIPANSVLVFQVELLDFKSGKEPSASDPKAEAKAATGKKSKSQ